MPSPPGSRSTTVVRETAGRRAVLLATCSTMTGSPFRSRNEPRRVRLPDMLAHVVTVELGRLPSRGRRVIAEVFVGELRVAGAVGPHRERRSEKYL